MKSFLALLFFCSLILLGCKEHEEKEEVIDNTPKISFELTVWNATNRTPANPNAALSPNASIFIFTTQADAENNKPKYTGKTNANGVCTMSVSAQETYYLKVVNGSAKNIKEGFLIAGIFKNQEHINNSPGQTPAAKVGDLIFADMNGDGIVNPADKTDYSVYSGLRTSTTLIKADLYISE